MRKLALALTVLSLAACQNFTWQGHSSGLTAEQREMGMRDVQGLADKYETETFFRGVRRRNDGRNNAFGRDLMRICDTIDRHFWNYDKNDPMVNYPSSTSKLEHLGRFGLVTVTSLPFVDEITTR